MHSATSKENRAEDHGHWENYRATKKEKSPLFQGTQAAQSVKNLILDFGSDHDVMVHEFEPHIGLCTDSTEPACVSLCPPLGAFSLSLSFSLTLS